MRTEKKLDAHYFELCDKLKTVRYGKDDSDLVSRIQLEIKFHQIYIK